MLDLATTYEAHALQIRRYVAAHVGDPDVADDICSAVWLAAVRGAATYEERGHPITAWLYSIARARVIDHQRQATRRHRWFIPYDERLSRAVPPPAEPLDWGWAATLSPRHRQALALAAAGHGVHSGAAAMGVGVRAYKAVLHRAREKARAAYAG